MPVLEEVHSAYDRIAFLVSTDGKWDDVDHDCRDTRAEVLAATSLIPVVFSENGCVVELGLWYDPYSDGTFEFAHDLDIDHIVPIKEAHESGADKWSDVDRSWFANKFMKSANLIPVWNSVNRSKGARELNEWLPPNGEYICKYIYRWVYVKWWSGLSVDLEECTFIKDHLIACS